MGMGVGECNVSRPSQGRLASPDGSKRDESIGDLLGHGCEAAAHGCSDFFVVIISDDALLGQRASAMQQAIAAAIEDAPAGVEHDLAGFVGIETRDLDFDSDDRG